ncbi:MAG: MarR family transcriptional regulator [Candidatus Woesearchaeota archaeon]|nr:MAG: MarR family transcriptional regulator [Candidatus Woesearchaeota archaeon]
MDVCVHYEKDAGIVDILPQNIKPQLRKDLFEAWNTPIQQKILLSLNGKEEVDASSLTSEIGHSASTIHENVERLTRKGLLESKIIYKGKKRKILTSHILLVTNNPKYKKTIQRFFQGLWVNSKKTKQIIEFLQQQPETFYTAEEIAAKTRIPLNEVQILLNNFDSPLTKGVSHAFGDAPFEKKVLYKGKSS